MFTNHFKVNFFSGQAIVEVLMVMSLMMLLLPSFLTSFVAITEGQAQRKQRTIATQLLQESFEVSRSVREKDWTSFANNGIFHPSIENTTWIFVPGPESIRGFTRQIEVSDVYRDEQGKIVDSGGAIDPSTKKIVVSISWTLPQPTTVSASEYLTRHESLSFIESDFADFDLGTKVNTFVTNDQGGEVILGAGGGGGNWCMPNLSVTSVDLSRQGVPTAISAKEGQVLAVTGGNASGPTFTKTEIVGDSPPQASWVGEYDNAKGNGVFGGEQNYGYITTTNNSEEVAILDLSQYTDPPSNTKYKKVGYFNAPGNSSGQSVFVAANVGYMTANNIFYTFDLSSKTGSRPQLNQPTVTLAGTGNKVVVVGNYAFVAINSASTQLQIIDVTNPAQPLIVAQANLGNSQAGVDLAVNSTGTRAYVVTNYSAGKSDFFIVNTENKTGNLPIIGAGFDTNGMSPKGVAITTGNRAIVVGVNGSQQYQVINIEDENNPQSCAGLVISNGVYGISTVLQSNGYAYSYIVTGDRNAELKIILGGAGGEYNSEGTFESNPFRPNLSAYPTAFNIFFANLSQPPQSQVRMQVGVANYVNNNCDDVTYTYLGPDADPGRYFEVDQQGKIEGQIPLVTQGNYSNPGNCFRYKLWFSTQDTTSTPILYDMTVNYSP